MKKQILKVVIVATIAAFIAGCAAKAPVMLDGKQVGIFVLSDRGIKDGMKEEERKDRDEMGQFMEEDLIEALKHEGYNATLIKSHDQYIAGSANYLIIVRIINLRLVGRASRIWVGAMAGPTILENHYEVSGQSGKVAMSYDDDDITSYDWKRSPHELNGRLVNKINEKLTGKSI